MPGLVISEFRTRGPAGASDEFIEVYNPSSNSINAGGLKIRSSSSGGTLTTKLTIANNTIIPAQGHLLLANSAAYSGTVVADQTFTSGIANDGGLALTLPDDTIIDQIGLSPGTAFREGMHLAPLPSDANQSYERRPGGLAGSTQDTQDNFNDFQLLTPSDPQNLHSSPTPGPSPLPTPLPTPGPSVSPGPGASPSPSATISPTPAPSPSPSPLPSPSPSLSPTPSPGSSVVISQIFGGGGNSGAPFRNDFIELFNSGTTAVSLSGWSVQYASAAASTWSVTSLTPVILAPGQYYLVQEAGGANGSALPLPDATGTINLAATAGKVALVRSTTVLSGTCPNDPGIVDLIGYGTSANCFRGMAPANAPSNSTAVVRGNSGCLNTLNNTADFSTGTPAPRNTSSPVHQCVNESAAVLIFRCLIQSAVSTIASCRGSPSGTAGVLACNVRQQT